ncbi:uncharacterized protein METZ01_LOCUS108913, partial [marine metagenome]
MLLLLKIFLSRDGKTIKQGVTMRVKKAENDK